LVCTFLVNSASGWCVPGWLNSTATMAPRPRTSAICGMSFQAVQLFLQQVAQLVGTFQQVFSRMTSITARQPGPAGYRRRCHPAPGADTSIIRPCPPVRTAGSHRPATWPWW
jgi:hypothetical protein